MSCPYTGLGSPCVPCTLSGTVVRWADFASSPARDDDVVGAQSWLLRRARQLLKGTDYEVVWDE